MIRPFTCICMLLAGASGLYLYQEKHSAQMLDREIAGIMHQTEATRERSSVLRAEWTLQNDPDRLARLAERFLKLKTITPGQFTTMAELDRRLPAVGQAEPVAAAEPRQEENQTVSAPESDAIAAAVDPARPAEAARPAEPGRPEAKPDPRKEAASPPPRPVDPPPRPADPGVRLAAAAPRAPERRATATREPAPPRRIASAEIRPATSPPVPSVMRSIRPVAYPAPPPAMRPPMVTSVLGMARTGLPPPVPYPPPAIGNGGG
ncbi:MAG: hypothetical protein FWD12_10930 [Alphaproteobacteria bacterium]|nr:hypothetical protein [Alphaproteobacteria bacterium]